MKKFVLFAATLIVLTTLIFTACNSNVNTATSSYNFTGTVNSKSTAASFTTGGKSFRGVDNVTGLLVYNGLTLKASGSYNTDTGVFVISAKGEQGSRAIVFAMEGKLVNGTPTGTKILITEYTNGKVTGTHTATMENTSISPFSTNTELARLDTKTYGYEGTWKQTAEGFTDNVILSPTSYTFIPDNVRTGQPGELQLENGVFLETKVLTEGSEWALMAAVDINLLQQLGASSGYAYFVHVIKIMKDGDSLKLGELRSETVKYILTDRDLAADLTGATAIPDSNFKVYKVTFNSQQAPTSVEEYDFSAETFPGFNYEFTMTK